MEVEELAPFKTCFRWTGVIFHHDYGRKGTGTTKTRGDKLTYMDPRDILFFSGGFWWWWCSIRILAWYILHLGNILFWFCRWLFDAWFYHGMKITMLNHHFIGIYFLPGNSLRPFWDGEKVTLSKVNRDPPTIVDKMVFTYNWVVFREVRYIGKYIIIFWFLRTFEEM